MKYISSNDIKWIDSDWNISNCYGFSVDNSMRNQIQLTCGSYIQGTSTLFIPSERLKVYAEYRGTRLAVSYRVR